MNPNSYIEPLDTVNTYLTDLKHILTSEPHDLDYDTEDVKNELLSLTEKDYVETIVDDKGTGRPPFRVFGKLVKNKDVYQGKD